MFDWFLGMRKVAFFLLLLLLVSVMGNGKSESKTALWIRENRVNPIIIKAQPGAQDVAGAVDMISRATATDKV